VIDAFIGFPPRCRVQAVPAIAIFKTIPRVSSLRTRQAFSIAWGQEAKLWELRAAVSYARLCGEQGRREEACDLLSPVYGWFTQGFDTPDLREAKALLAEIE
jgi:predicted ATPase